MIFNQTIDPIFIFRILSDPKKHWTQNRVSFVYFSDPKSESIINFHHNDVPKCPTIDDLHLIDTLYSFPQIVDPATSGEEIEGVSGKMMNAELAYWFKTGKKANLEPDSTIRRYWDMGAKNVNDAIPIMRWLDHCRKIRDLVGGLVVDDPAFAVYDRFVMNLRSIERRGARSIKQKNEYTSYNPYTLTGRPSNHFDGINYAALNQRQRNDYISRYVNGFLIDVDLSSFHLELIYSMLGLDAPDDIYKSLSVFYPTGADPKAHTFKQIYGGIDQSLLDKTPFMEIDQLASDVFDSYKSGDLTTLLHGRKFVLPDGLNRWKVFNYCLQSLETEHNMGLIDRCLFENLNLVMYTYDSFLFDIHPDDVSRSIQKIKQIFSGLKYKVKVGRNYGKMKLVSV